MINRKANTAYFYVTPQILVDELEECGYPISFYGWGYHLSLSNVSFITSDTCVMPDPMSLHIAYGNLPDLSSFNSEHCILWISSPSEHILSQGCTIISIHKIEEPLALFNKINVIFNKYEQWNHCIQQAVDLGDLQKLTALGRDIFKNPLFIHDNYFNYLASQRWIAGQTEPVINRRTGLGMIPIHVVDDLRKSKAYKNTLQTHGAKMYEDFNIDSYRVLYVNLWDGAKYVGRLCIDEMATPILPSHFQIAEFYSIKILETIKKQTANINRHFTVLEKLLIQMLDSGNVNHKELQECLALLDWEQKEQYLAVKIVCKNVEEEGSISNLCYKIESNIAECCAYPFNHALFALFNLSVGKTTLQSIHEKITALFDCSQFIIGFSDLFYDIEKFPIYYKQSEMAISLGSFSEKHSVYFFHEITFPCLLFYGSSQTPLENLMPPALRILQKYDEENGTELLLSLEEYLRCNENITKAAEKLFIHRTTLIYRISRIQELTGLEFDYNTRLYLGISFYMRSHPEVFSSLL